MGGYNATSFSTADNTGYAEGALFGVKYRDLPITSYAWQIATTMGGPNAWWEATSGPPDPTDPWEGSHAVSNVTSSFTATAPDTCARSTYGVSFEVTKPASQRVVTISLQGTLPGGPVYIQLPSFRTSGVSNVQGGTYDMASATVTAAKSGTSIVVTLSN